MDLSSQISPTKSLVVIRSATDSTTITDNHKPYGSTLGESSKPGVKREYENGSTSNLSTKKPKTSPNQYCTEVAILDPKPLTIVDPVTPKLSKQFWKAGDDHEDEPVPQYCGNDAAVRVHPQFLHANATRHKWALGALAELLDNSLDEVCNGATYVHVDSKTNQKDGKSNILIVEDNGGGMNPNRFRECLSLGYSRKRNMANTVGQYGNGFKTSTMRLGADALVFSRCRGTNGNKPTQSIGMLSYTFLYETRKCEGIVPTIDFELVDNNWKEIIYNNSTDDWSDNLDTILKWSPYLSQRDLFDQFDFLEEQGTRIVIYNLWEDDEGELELDFDTDPHDIQLRGVNRDEKNIEMAKAYPNSKHFLTYRHSLRSYASILYLRLPKDFKIILRGKDVEHHSLVDDMMMTEDINYRPMRSPDCPVPDQEMFAALKIGFVKDAHHHIDIQGFNVYHKNRLIKPFWRVWNAAGSDGRGVIGILEANFIQPAHNKQGFERTAVLAKLENRLNQHQKNYWSSRCHEIGYAPRRKQKNHESFVPETVQRLRDPVPGVPLNHISHNKEASSSTAPPPIAPPPGFARKVGLPEMNRSSRDATQESVVDVKPDIGLMNARHGHGNGIRVNETGSVNLEAELQRVKMESFKMLKEAAGHLHYLQKLQNGNTKQVADMHREKALLKLQLKNSKAKFQESQNIKNESAKLVAELLREKTMLESQLKASTIKIQELDNSVKVKDDEVAELQRQKEMLELQLENSKVKEFEGSQKAMMEIIQNERTRRDLTEDDLRKKLERASGDIDKLTEKVNMLEADKAFCKKRHMQVR